MITQEQRERYKYQQTESGRKAMQLLENLKEQYHYTLGIPKNEIKTGRLSPLVNERTGEIDKFLEY